MSLIIKNFFILLISLLAVEFYPQVQDYSVKEIKINNTLNSRDLNAFNKLISFRKDFNKVLDSIIIISTSGDRKKLAFYYNEDLTLNNFLISYLFNNQWMVSDRHTNTYNSEGKLVSILWEAFNNLTGEWSNDALDIYSYDTSGNCITHLHQTYIGGEFQNIFRYNYYYDSSNNLSSSIYETWNNDNWLLVSRIINHYNSSNLLDTTLFQYWVNNQLLNSQLNIYEYDSNFNVVTNLVKRWDENNWLNFAKGLFRYDNNKLISENWFLNNNDQWENWERKFYEYDNDYYLIHLYGEEWQNGQWLPADLGLLIKLPDGTKLGYLAKELFLYYSPSTAVDRNDNTIREFNLFQNYPNPFNPITKIRWQSPFSGHTTLKVYDVLGREIGTLVDEYKSFGNYEAEFNISQYSNSDIASGIYFYRLSIVSTDGFTVTKVKKMILNK
ncbi:5'-Nucleotidase domain protein [Ignavibacterium album JCM 16511]|uniref:5'-Nucleotidase domain protein n=1 Tax=Ignavibacterium album (strain DSM 19864 / JCM 16511 / NBRC 101810 / Mat9-16) TaxID=945713 RepID=I0ALL9_IGNAJ|nr:T9SS type A sorting domain-containing protein [Ignavibacterium album]AFH49876.1 5'-Nucleotidase domain protein [Ignavibacterium album JCM 16511]